MRGTRRIGRAGTEESDGEDGYLLTPQEVAHWLRVSVRQVLRLPINRIKLGHRTVRYREGDVRRYVSKF